MSYAPSSFLSMAGRFPITANGTFASRSRNLVSYIETHLLAEAVFPKFHLGRYTRSVVAHRHRHCALAHVKLFANS